MADLENTLASIPGLAGYLGQEQFTQRRNTGELANATQAANLAQHFDKIRKEQGLRQALSGLGPDAKEEDMLRAVAPFVGADTAFKSIESKQARQATASNTREIALARLAQQAGQFDHRQMSVDQRAQFDQWYRKQAADIAQGRAAYELPPDLYSRPQGGPPTAPQQGGLPAYADALAAAKAQARAGQPVNIQTDPNSPQPITAPQDVPAPAVATPPAAAPVAPPVEAPAAPQPQAPDAGNLDARDIAARAAVPVEPPVPPQGAPVARGEPPPVPGAPVARGLPTPPPELESLWAGMGRKRADMERAKWMAANIGGAGEAQLDPAGLKVAAWEKLLYGTDPKGLGKASAQQRAQVANERARIGKELGLSDQEMAMLPQDNKVKMKAVGNLTNWGANVAKAADQVERSLDVAIDYAKKLDPGRIQMINRAVMAGKTEFNDPTANAYAVAINTVAREYGRLMSGPTSNAMLPVEAMKKGDSLINNAMDVRTLQEVKKVMLLDADITKQSVNRQIENLRGTITNPGSKDGFLGGDKPSGAPVARFENGKIYTDAKGRKAKYLGEGKWEEQ